MALPKRYETVAQLGALSSTGDPEGEITLTGRVPPSPPRLPVGRGPPAPAAALGREGRRRSAPTAAPAGERSFEMPERIVTVHAFRELWRREGRRRSSRRGRRTRSSARSGTYVRSLIADLGDGYCLELRRTAIGDFSVEEACPPPPRGSAWEDPPVIELASGARASRRGVPPIGFAADVKVIPLPEVEHGRSRSIAVGTFDGVHLGHREVIRGADSVLTFDPHPVSVVAPQHTPRLLTAARAQGRTGRLARACRR